MNSLDFLEACTARESNKAILDLITIESDDLASPLRLVNNRADIVSRGNTFTAWAFSIPTPGDRQDKLPTVTLVMDAIYDPDAPMTGGPLGVINTIGEGTVTLEWVMHTALDTVEYGPFEFTIQTSQFNATTLSISLAYEDLLNAEWPGYSMTPIFFPGLFEG